MPDGIACAHYTRQLARRMIKAWYIFIRERGTITRLRNKYFLVWAQWAPTNKSLRIRETAVIKAKLLMVKNAVLDRM
jgi:hypothetical protein